MQVRIEARGPWIDGREESKIISDSQQLLFKNNFAIHFFNYKKALTL